MSAMLWENESAPGGASNALRGLTHSLDLDKEGLAMKATCSVDECGKEPKSAGLCWGHYQRKRKYGDPSGESVRALRTCAVEDCQRKHFGLGFCQSHHRRFTLTGDPLGSTRRSKPSCSVDECDRPHKAQGFCDNHYARLLRGSDPHVPWEPIGEGHPRWVERADLDYDTLHERLKIKRGKASAFRCVECGQAARDWAYQHNDPEPLVAPQGEYTDDLSCYEPMCRSCHAAYDKRVRDLRMLVDERSVG